MHSRGGLSYLCMKPCHTHTHSDTHTITHIKALENVHVPEHCIRIQYHRYIKNGLKLVKKSLPTMGYSLWEVKIDPLPN